MPTETSDRLRGAATGVGHTPGPWEAILATTPEGTFSYWLHSPAYGAVGYWCGHKSHHTNNYWLLTESDARLIAAAPDLLDALEVCEIALSALSGAVNQEPGPATMKARAAIAKAIGT